MLGRGPSLHGVSTTFGVAGVIGAPKRSFANPTSLRGVSRIMVTSETVMPSRFPNFGFDARLYGINVCVSKAALWENRAPRAIIAGRRIDYGKERHTT
jgi:hypothetical protein